MEKISFKLAEETRKAAFCLGIIVSVFGVVVLGTLLLLAITDWDCKDFVSQKSSQSFFEMRGGPERDRHNLDADNDGLACETLKK